MVLCPKTWHRFTNIKRILERYNGEGKDAIEYAERNYGLYKIFEKYNEAMRAIS